jgi:hypothetical protein
MDDEEIRIWVISLLVSVLDLAHHPENATKYGVIILAGIRPIITNPDAAVTQPKKKVPMLFKVLRVTRLANSDVEEIFPRLKVLSEDLNRTLDEQLSSAERQNTMVVRAAWVSDSENPSIHHMFCEHINRPQCTLIKGLKCTTEEFIRYLFLYSSLNRLSEKIDSHFNAQAELHPDIKKKFTIVRPMISCSTKLIKG